MGMFDKDKELGTQLTNLFPLGVPFIVWNARITREDFPTTFGPAAQSTLTVSRTENPNEKYDATSLASAIAAKVREAEPGDFPAVVTLAKVPSRSGQEALVLQYLKPYGDGQQQQGSHIPATDPEGEYRF